MNAPLFVFVGLILLLLTLAPVVYRARPKGTDWALEVAFIRLQFPQEQRDVAQQIAAGLAEIVGMKIKQLTPQHDLTQIAGWAEDRIHARDLITLFMVAFDVKCSAQTTFADVVENVTRRKRTRDILTIGA